MRKNRNKKIIVIAVAGTFLIILFFAVIGIRSAFKEKHQREVELAIGFAEEIEVEVYSKTKISEALAEDEIVIVDDQYIDTNTIGQKRIKFKYRYGDEVFSKTMDIEVVDTTKPTIFANSSYTVTKGSDRDFVNYILSGDNYDDNPKREIIGKYDLDTVGRYDVTYHIEDSSGNTNEQNFTIRVIEPVKNENDNSSSTEPVRIDFKDVLKEHKNAHTEVGIDVSKWQGEIDFEKVRQAGCQFVIIRLGYQTGIDGELVVDPYYEENIEKATEAGLKVGVYLYTYANDVEDAVSQADWVVKHLGTYKVDLGVSYDWESWSLFNQLKLSYRHFTELADSFIARLKEKGYDGMLYSSKYYLENIWTLKDQKIWLAHYTNKTDYHGKYRLWQRTNIGRIDGINGAVDIDISYEN